MIDFSIITEIRDLLKVIVSELKIANSMGEGEEPVGIIVCSDKWKTEAGQVLRCELLTGHEGPHQQVVQWT